MLHCFVSNAKFTFAHLIKKMYHERSSCKNQRRNRNI